LAERAELQAAHARALAEADLLRAQIATLRRREQEVLAAAAERAEALLQETLQRAKALKRTATVDRQQRGKALAELQALRRAVRGTRADAAPEVDAEGLSVGTEVRVAEYDATGPVVELRGQDVVVQLGLLKVTVPRRSVTVVTPPKAAARSPAVTLPTRFEHELNLRGERVEAAIAKVRDFILEAHALKVPSVRILHGKGTGALREAVRQYLKGERLVARFEDAVPYEGGHGVTVAYLRLES
jgi:DNA mismatch repair protein MutS2